MSRKTLFSLIMALGAFTQASAASVLSLSTQFTDSTIVMPGSLETDVHKMMENWYLRNYIEMDRNADSSADGLISDELLIKRLAAMPTSIEMPYNQVVRQYIEMYTQRRRQLIENMLGMSLYYMPIFEEALEREGLPLELKYIPVIESALNPDAVSRAGATGLWQFMIPAAKDQGLQINSVVDERRDPYRSSAAAAKYFKQLYSIFGDWSLAIAAYNCGPGNVAKALKRAGDGDGKKRDFWDVYNYLPKETRGYVPCFIAANYVMTYYPEHNISPALARRPLITDSVHVTKNIDLRQISEVLDIPLEEIQILNPQYRDTIIPGEQRPYSLVLPSKQIYCYILSEDSIVNHQKGKYGRRLVVDPNSGTVESVKEDGDYIITQKTQWHKVKRGETLTSIAKRYGVTVKSLKQDNGGISTVKRGQSIKITTTQRVKKPKEETPVNDTVTGDVSVNATSEEIASTETTDVMLPESEADGDAVEETETVTEVVEKPASKPKQATPQTVTVRKGDTLSSIARKNRTTVAKIKQLNGLKSDAIQAGQKLKVR